jgi:hypothetical protein
MPGSTPALPNTCGSPGCGCSNSGSPRHVYPDDGRHGLRRSPRVGSGIIRASGRNFGQSIHAILSGPSARRAWLAFAARGLADGGKPISMSGVAPVRKRLHPSRRRAGPHRSGSSPGASPILFGHRLASTFLDLPDPAADPGIAPSQGLALCTKIVEI